MKVTAEKLTITLEKDDIWYFNTILLFALDSMAQLSDSEPKKLANDLLAITDKIK